MASTNLKDAISRAGRQYLQYIRYRFTHRGVPYSWWEHYLINL